MKLNTKLLRQLIKEQLGGDPSEPPVNVEAGDSFVIPGTQGNIDVTVTRICLYGVHLSTPIIRIYYTYDGPGVGKGESDGSVNDFLDLWEI